MKKAAAVVRVQLLGGFRVELPDGRIAGPWERPSARRLFQIVVLRDRRRIGREEVADLLFQNLPPTRAANAVSKALSMARAALAPFPVLGADRDVIWIDGVLEVDAETVRTALRRALAQPPGDSRDAAVVAALAHRGRLLDDELYVDWGTAEREELERLRVDAYVALARDRSGGHGRASPHSVADAWSDVFALDGSNEEACSALLGTYAGLGQPDQVVRTYRRTAVAMRRLGLEPSEALERQYGEAVARARTVRPSGAHRAPARTAFGRDATRAGLLEAITSPERRSAATVLVSGPPGIGKSHTLDTLRRDLEAAGWPVAYGGAAPGDRRSPLRSLRAVLARLEDEDEGAGSLLEMLGPDAEWFPNRAPDTRAALVNELRRVLDHQAAAVPFVLMLDDVQWMDSGLQDIVTELLAAGTGRRWATVLAARSGDDSLTVRLPPDGRRLELAPLPANATEALVRHISPRLTDRDVGRVAARSAGNPLFAIELARQPPARPERSPAEEVAVPSLIVELLQTRSAQCSPVARRLLSLVALLGGEASVEVILRLADDVDTTVEGLDELLRAQLLEEHPAGVKVSHPLLAEATVATLSATDRADLHEMIASHSDDEAAARHRLAAFELSGRRERARAAAEAGFRAGRHARRLFSDDAALELAVGGLRAYDVMAPENRADLRPDAVAAWLNVGEIHRDHDRREEAEQAFDAALALAGTDDERARAWSAQGSVAYRVGDFEGAVGAYEKGVASLLEPSSLVRARLEAEMGWAYSRMGRIDDALALLRPATAVLAQLGDGSTAGHGLDQLATILGVAGQAEEGLDAMQRAFAALGPTGDERLLGILYIHRAALYGLLERFGEALADITAAHRFAADCGDRYRESVIHWMASDIHERRGDPAAALVERDAELALLAQVGNPRNEASAHAARARLLTGLDRHDEAARAATCARTLAGELGDEAFCASIEQQLTARLRTF